MTPFQQFTLWARRAPAGERTSAAVGAATVLAILVWLVALPASDTAQVSASRSAAQTSAPTTDGGPAPSAEGANPSGISTSSQGANNAPGADVGAIPSGGPTSAPRAAASNGTTRVAGPGSATGCVAPPGTDQGVTASRVKVAVLIADVAGTAGNSTFGVASPKAQESFYQDVIDSVNAGGGAACHKISPIYFRVNSADSTALQQVCLEIQQAGVFAVLDPGVYAAFPALSTCYPRARIPYFGGTTLLTRDQIDQYYPYVLMGRSTYETLYRNTVFALKQRGFFKAPSFAKLGVLHRDCVPHEFEYVKSLLLQAGLNASQIIDYNVGCPHGLYSSPDQLQQAILKFQEKGVNSVTFGFGEYADWSNWTSLAEQQGFRPRYGLADEGFVTINNGAQHPEYQNMAGALLVTADQWGAESTPGMRPAAATTKCNAIYAARGRPDIYHADKIGEAGYACNQVWQFAAAMSHAPRVARAALAQGLVSAKSVPFSWPWGPNDFAKSRGSHGGQFWRVDQFFTSCSCWRVIDPTFHRSF